MAHSPEEQERLIADEVDQALFGDSTLVASPPSDRDQAVSRLLHARLTTRFPPHRWPPHRLYTYLQTTIGSDSIAHDDDAVPTTPPTSSLEVFTLQQSPRVQQARSSAEQLKTLACWSELVSFHNAIGTLRPEAADAVINLILNGLAPLIVKHKAALSKHLFQLRNAEFDVHTLRSALADAYHALSVRAAAFDSTDQALAFVLVHIAASDSDTFAYPDIQDANRRFASQFGRKYHGDAPSRFIEFVTRLDRSLDSLKEGDVKPYFRGTPIVQSSGTGKSRMVLECRRFTPLLYVCLRPTFANRNAKSGFPFPDQGVRTFFEDASTSHPKMHDLHVACFLGAWFEELSCQLHLCSTDEAKHLFVVQLNRLDQNDGANAKRVELFANVAIRATSSLEAADRYAKGHAAVFGRYIRGPLLDLNEQIRLISSYMHSSRNPQNQGAVVAGHIPPVLVAFDECVEMNVDGDKSDETQLNSLRRAWNYISALRASDNTLTFWLVLMSTSSSAASLVKHIDAITSDRDKSAAPMPTFVGVGFDVLTAEQAGLSKASKATQLTHIIFYGRPLWSSLQPYNFWANAISKLTGGRGFDCHSDAHCFSVMASRLALRLVPTHTLHSPMFGAQKIFLDKAVDRHMRIVQHVTGKAAIHVDSPSEPVLAIAALLVMLPFARDKVSQQTSLSFYGTVLESFRDRCLLSSDVPLLKGTHGELASRVAFMVACDAAKCSLFDELRESRLRESKKAPTADDYRNLLIQAVRLEDILSNLAKLDDSNLAELRKRIADVCERGQASDRYALKPQGVAAAEATSLPAWINFTHFEVLPEPIESVTPEYLWYCWKRGMALQMNHDQPGIDGIIPVFVGNLDQRFVQEDTNNTHDIDDDNGGRNIEMHAARYMTYIAWEAKNRDEPQTAETDPSKAAKLAGPSITRASIAPQEEPLTERALVSVLFDLGTSVSFRGAPRGLQPRLQLIKGQQCPRLCIRGVLDKHAYPCLDYFGIRSIFCDILSATAATDPYAQLNTMPNPAWNDMFHPKLDSVTAAAAADADQTEGQQQINMDLD